MSFAVGFRSQGFSFGAWSVAFRAGNADHFRGS